MILGAYEFVQSRCDGVITMCIRHCVMKEEKFVRYLQISKYIDKKSLVKRPDFLFGAVENSIREHRGIDQIGRIYLKSIGNVKENL